MMWRVATTDGFDDWFANLGEEEQAEVIAKADSLYDAHLAELRARRSKNKRH